MKYRDMLELDDAADAVHKANVRALRARARADVLENQIKALADALDFAVRNLEEIALPALDSAGQVTSVPAAIEKARAALSTDGRR